MSAVASTVVAAGNSSAYQAAIASTLAALERPLMRVRWPHGWKIPPQAFEPISLAYVLGFFERHCEEIGLLSDVGLYQARVELLIELLGANAGARLDETLDLVAQHEINLLQSWQVGRKEADAQLGPDQAIACSWQEYMYLEIEAYSFSYPRD
jgi:hypothetical protein